jgi:hypothetical protein
LRAFNRMARQTRHEGRKSRLTRGHDSPRGSHDSLEAKRPTQSRLAQRQSPDAVMTRPRPSLGGRLSSESPKANLGRRCGSNSPEANLGRRYSSYSLEANVGGSRGPDSLEHSHDSLERVLGDCPVRPKLAQIWPYLAKLLHSILPQLEKFPST